MWYLSFEHSGLYFSNYILEVRNNSNIEVRTSPYLVRYISQRNTHEIQSYHDSQHAVTQTSRPYTDSTSSSSQLAHLPLNVTRSSDDLCRPLLFLIQRKVKRRSTLGIPSIYISAVLEKHLNYP